METEIFGQVTPDIDAEALGLDPNGDEVGPGVLGMQAPFRATA